MHKRICLGVCRIRNGECFAIRGTDKGVAVSQPLASFQVSESFQNLLDTVFHSIPKILVFLAILVIGWIVAKVLARLVDMILRRIKFDRFVERGVVGQALARSNTDATSLIAKIVYYAILLVALQMAFGVWGPNPVSTMLNAVVGWLPKAVVAIVIIVIASAIARVVKDLINGAIGGLSYGPFLATVASIVIIALGVIAALNQVGIAAAVTQPILYTVLLTGGAVIAIGVGGGLIKPMQERWERMLSAAERETSTQIAAYQQGRADAMRAPQHARQPQDAQPAHIGSQDPGQSPAPGYSQTSGYSQSDPGASGYPQGAAYPEDSGYSQSDPGATGYSQGDPGATGYSQASDYPDSPGYQQGTGWERDPGYPEANPGDRREQGDWRDQNDRREQGDWRDPGTGSR
jgi:Conserved TM helix